MVEDSPVERVAADRSRHPARLRHSPDFFLDALLLLYRHGLRVSRPRSGRLYFQVATHLAHPRRFDPCKLSAIASTRALRAQPARKSAAFKAGRRSSSFGSHGPVHALRWSETLLPEDTAPPSPCPICAEAFAALRQRHRHAVHARNRVKQGTNRVLPVVLDVAPGID